MNLSAAEVQSNWGTSGPPRVLVVDDDAELCRAIQRGLRRFGIAVDAAYGGHEAIKKVETNAYDVLVLDLQMAQMDGFDVFKVINSVPNAPQTILHSAYLDVPTTVAAMRAGVSEVLEKPTAMGLLAERVLQLSKPRLATSVRETADRLETSNDPASRLLGNATQMQELREQIRRIACFRDMSVLIEGPTGTGKELVAEAIHAASCPNEPFVTINCAAVPDHLFESELFGHDAGAFTSARGPRPGLLEEAGRGTIFLDEIGEMPPAMQPKLLRVLEGRQFRRVGSNKTKDLHARVISATNRPLASMDGPVRADLYFRLAGYTLSTPPLRDRLEDIPLLARHLLSSFAKRYSKSALVLDDAAMAYLTNFDWPGNVRELRTVVENAAVLSTSGVVSRYEIAAVLSSRGAQIRNREELPQSGNVSIPATFPPTPSLPTPFADAETFSSLPDLERQLIVSTYTECGENLSRSARRLGIPRSTLRDKLRKLGLR